MRFLLSRRWLLFALTVAVLAYATTLLGNWQFHRLDERRADNHRIARNLAAPVVPAAHVFGVDDSVHKADEWRLVTVDGTWDDEHSIVVKYQTDSHGTPGIDVVTPLVTADGAAVLVDRGWMATPNTGDVRPKLPAVTPGQVTVTGWARTDATGRATKVSDLSTRAISSRTVAGHVPYRLYRGFIDLSLQTPQPVKRLGKVELPDDTSEGPHFFYGLQWWFFGFLAVFGFGYLLYDEWRRARQAESDGGEPDGDAQRS